MKVAKKAAPAAKAAAAPAKPAKAEKTAAPSRYIGGTSGLRIQEFQNKTILENPRKKLTDVQLAKLWREEFPKAAKFEEKHVRGVRGLVNLGKHKNDPPAEPVHAYDDDGTKLPLRGEKKAAAEAAKASKAEAPAKKPLKLAAKKKPAA
jgi:hypothetical protein